MTRLYRERPVQFGPNGGLFGVLTLPASTVPAQGPVVVVPNSGVIHRVGASRVHVLLARALTCLGIRTLRFDLSGIGDSGRRGGVASLAESIELDLTDALDFLAARYHADSFVPLGLCSGAYDALYLTLRDPRVTGVVAIDVPGSFRNYQHVLVHYSQRVLSLAVWRHTFSKPRHTFRSLLWRVRDMGKAEGAVGLGVRPIMSREALDHMLHAMNDRNVKSLFLFTGGRGEYYNYERQFRDNFPEQSIHPNVSHVFLPRSDHVFSRSDDRRALINAVTTWFKNTSFSHVESQTGKRTQV